MKCHQAKEAGFTLVELLIVLVLISLLFTLSLSSYQTLIARHHATSTVTQLVTAISYARTEAIRRHTIVTLCKSNNGKNCGGEWRQGWLVFVDPKATGQISTINEILRVNLSKTPVNNDLQWVAQRSNDFLQLEPSGNTHGQAGTFYYYADAKNKKGLSKIIVSQIGRVRVETE